MYIHCHSYFSLRYGIHSEETILKMAAEAGAKTVALTDINNTSACLNFIRLAPNYGIKPVVGIDFREGVQHRYIALAKNNEGFKNINEFLSQIKCDSLPVPEQAPPLDHVTFIYPYEQVLLMNKQAFRANEYIGISIRELKKLRFSKLSKWSDHFVVCNAFTFTCKQDFNVHRLLRAVDNNELLSKLPQTEEANPEDIFLSMDQIRLAYQGYPEIISNTEQLLDHCEIYFDFSPGRPHQNKKRYSQTIEGDIQLIKQLTKQALPNRYDQITPAIESRLKKELDVIIKMDYVPFFLINWDIITYAKRNGYFHVGRGSGANSIVAYLLGITDVDPIELDLYFERFMNLYRSTPPDFDIDFSWRDREDVTQYIFNRFGANGQAALLGTYNTFKHSASVRELGKVFGLPKHEIDKLSDGRYTFKTLDKLNQLVLIYAKRIQGMPNYISVHSAGIVVSEKPMHYFSATDMPPKGFPTTQFDMVIAEDVGLYKYDILGQRGLGKIKDSLSIIQKNQPDKKLHDIHYVKPLLHDPKINHQISQAQCIGCFYVESPAMRMLLKKLEVDNYLGLVAASSIIRPGVAKSGMMREYILRHKDPERRREAHPVMWDLMADTYGVMVYQEDVIKVAHHFAGLTLGEADVLRRGMSGKYRSREEFQKVKEKFASNCAEKGYTPELTQEVWRQIESFAGYAFAKGHSASYAIESYQSLYLKTYFPLEYMVAVLNNGGGFYRVETYVHEARMYGATIHPPCINKSFAETSIEGTDIYLGFQHLHHSESMVVNRILLEREQQGPFQSFDDFIDRVTISIEQLDILIRIDAFRFTNIDRRTLLWQAYFKLNHIPKNHTQPKLFKAEHRNFTLPDFTITQLETAFDQIELIGFPLCNPFLLMAHQPDNQNLAVDMKDYINRQFEIYGYMVTVKSTTTVHQDRMQFGTFLDQSGQWIDTVHFPPVVRKYPFRGKGIYRLVGKVTEEFGFISLEVQVSERMDYVEDPRFSVKEVY